MAREDAPAAVVKAKAWLEDWFDSSRFGLQAMAMEAAKAPRLPPPNIPPFTVPTPKTVRAYVSSDIAPMSAPISPRSAANVSSDIAAMSAPISPQPTDNDEVWTEMRIQDCYDRTRGETDKERVFVLDGMTVADAL